MIIWELRKKIYLFPLLEEVEWFVHHDYILLWLDRDRSRGFETMRLREQQNNNKKKETKEKKTIKLKQE